MTFIEFTEKAGHSQLFLFLSHTFSSSVLQCLLPAVCIDLLFILNKTKIGWIYLESLVSPQFILLLFYNRIWAFFSTQKCCPQLQHKLVYSEEFPDRRTSGISKCVEMIKVKDVAGCFSRHFSPKEQSQWLPYLQRFQFWIFNEILPGVCLSLGEFGLWTVTCPVQSWSCKTSLILFVTNECWAQGFIQP